MFLEGFGQEYGDEEDEEVDGPDDNVQNSQNPPHHDPLRGGEQGGPGVPVGHSSHALQALVHVDLHPRHEGEQPPGVVEERHQSTNGKGNVVEAEHDVFT